MKAKIWILTYRRQVQLKECIGQLILQNIPTVVVQPHDEDNAGLAHRTLTLPPEYSGVGAGAPREFAAWTAVNDGDDAMIFVDDDVIVNSSRYDLTDLLDSLEMVPDLGVVACSYAGYYKRHPDYPHLQVMPSFGVAYAVRLSAHTEVGGFDNHLVRLEDVDLAYRLRVAGYWIGADTRVRIGHKNYMEGGMKAAEAGDVDREKAKEIANQNRLRMAELIVSKYPPNTMSVDKRGWPRFRRGELAELQRMYQNGLIRITKLHVK